MKRIALLLITVLVVLCIIPFTTVEAPDWEVNVVDKSGKPLGGVNVGESYKNYSAEQTGGELTLVTDERGLVVFPERTIRSSGFKRMIAIALSATGGVHASFGPHAYVFAFGICEGDSVKNGYVEDWTGSPSHNRSTIICRPLKKD